MKKLNTMFVIFFVLFFTASIFAQTASITWPLTINTSPNAPAGNIQGSPETIGAGPSPAMSIFSYNNGQRLWCGNTGWAAGSIDFTRYIQFNAGPTSGNNFTVSSLSFKYGDNPLPANFNILKFQAYYSTDNFNTSTVLNVTPLFYLNSTMTTFTATNLNVLVANGQTFSLRIYPYSPTGSNQMTPSFAIHDTVVINGTTSPSTNISACTDFEDSTFDGWQVNNTLEAIKLDGANHYIETTDQSGASIFFNSSKPLIGDWTTYLTGGCGSLCWDVTFLYGGDNYNGQIPPQTTTPWIAIFDNAGDTASFVTNGPISVGDGWHSYCAPLSLVNPGDPLPSNSYGHWVMSVNSVNGWNTLLSNVTSVRLPVDPTSYQNERFGYDNICIKNTGDCTPPPQFGSICGMKFNDLNGNGVKDPGEPGLQNWIINLKYQQAAGFVTLTDTTDAKGNYCFDNLQPGGIYTVSETNQSGWLQTFPLSPGTYTVTLSSGQHIDTLNFGNHLISSSDTCSTDSVNISTGWNHNANSTYNNLGSDQDVFWTLVTAPMSNGTVNLNGPAWVIEKYPYGWANPTAGSQWISAFQTYGSNRANINPSDTPYVFQKRICVSSTTYLTFNFKVLADNRVVVKFVDSNGNVISTLVSLTTSTTSNFTTATNVNQTLPNVAPGTYFLKIELRNDNSGSPMGVNLQGTVTGASSAFINSLCCNPPGSSITGFKFNDINNNGVYDNEPKISGWTINLTGNNVSQSSTTDANGNYLFTGLSAGTYTISETAQLGWVAGPLGTQQTITIGTNQAVNNINFGNRVSADSCHYLCNSDFEDNQVVSAGNFGWFNESLISCWRTTEPDSLIEVWHSGYGGVPAYSGNQFIELNAKQVGTLYQNFTAIPGNTVTISFAHRGRAGYTNQMSVSIGPAPLGSGTPVILGPFTANDTAWTVNSVTYPFPNNGVTAYVLSFISLPVGGTSAGGNFLDAINISCPSSICGIKFNDLNGNGQQDLNEPGLPNWIINLTGTVTLTDTTDANGNYCFNNLPAGTYTVAETNKTGWHQTFPNSPGTHTVTLTAGQHIDGLNFGNQLSTTGSICDSLSATATNDTTGDCCWSISLIQPSNTNGITGIQFLPLSPNTFVLGSSQLGNSFSSGWLFVANTMNQFTVRRLTGNIPAGQLNDFFKFCLNNLSSPQYVVVNWLNASNGVVCSDTVKVNCDIPCVTFNKDTVICNTNNYTLQYSFTNNATYAISKIEVVQTVPAGITVTPSTLTTPSVNPGLSSGLQTFTINGAIPNTTVAIHFRFTSSDSCCSCTDILFVNIPSCMCNELGVSLNQDLLNCSDTLSISNNFSGNYFTQINLTALTAGTTFGTWNTNTTSNWYSLNTFAANSVQLVNTGNGFIPSGNSNGIINFSLSGYTTSTQKILVEWIRNDSVKCIDTLTTHCVPPPPTMYCVQLIDDTLICRPDGSFEYKFKVKNNSTYTTTGFQLNAVSPSTISFSPNNFSNVSIGPSMISPEQTVIISGINPDTAFCFDIALYKHIVQHDTLYSWCCHSDTICTTTPNCGGYSDCIPPPSGMVGWWPGDGNANDISGLNNNGTLVGGLNYINGKVAQAFNVSNVADYIIIPDNSSLNFDKGNFSIDAWVKTTDNANALSIANKFVITTTSGVVSLGYWLLSESGKLGFYMGDGSASALHAISTNQIADGIWHFVAVTVDRKITTGGKLYIDGNLVLTFDPTTKPNSITNTSSVVIARPNITSAVKEQVDEVEIFNRVLDSLEIRSIWAADSLGKCKPTVQGGCVTPPDGMVAWWPLDETTGSTATDLAGFNNIGKYFNGPQPVPAKVLGGLQFDGINDYVEVPDQSELNFGTGNFSFDAWIQTTDSIGVKDLVDKRTSGTGYIGYTFFLINGKLSLELADGSYTNYTSPFFVANGKWHHIAVTVSRADPKGITFYLDGIDMQSGDPTLHPGSLNNKGPLRISSQSFADGFFFKGILDEIELFNRVLMKDEIISIFKAGSAGKCKLDIPTSIKDNKTGESLPQQYRLEQNYPNPFNPTSVIRYDIPKAGFVKISVYDILGREIRVLVNEEKSPGYYKIIFDANNLASGIYFYTIRTGDFVQSKKLILIK